MKLDITRGIQRKGIDVPFDLVDAWGEDHWSGDTITFVRPVSFSGTYMLADETVLVRGVAGIISTDDSTIKVLRIPTNEELPIARDTLEIVSKL